MSTYPHTADRSVSVSSEPRLAVTPPEDVRICMPTWRAFSRAPFHCYRYEAQDVLTSVEAVDMMHVQPAPSFRARERLLRRLMWYPTGRFAVTTNPGLREVRLTRRYDAFVAVCQSWWDLLYINAINGWEKMCRTSIVWLDELFAGMLPHYRHWLPSLNRFEHVVLGHMKGVEEAGRLLGRTCHWAPPAVDVMRFGSGEPLGARPITFLSVGRRHEGIHVALRKLAESRDMFYLFDTLQGESMVVKDPREHREMYAAKLRRSRFMLVGPGMMDEPETAGEHIIGARFFEGAAAGAVLIGERPRCPESDILFDWPDSVIEMDTAGADAERVLDAVLSDDKRMRAASAEGVRQCAKRHDWIHRWLKIYEVAGLSPTAEMLSRKRRLEEAVHQGSAPESASG